MTLRSSILTLFQLCLLTLFCSAKDHYPGLSIGDHNYEPTLQRTMFSFVLFYKEGCYHCDKLEPTYKLLAEAYHYQGSELQILAVNVKENQRVQSIERIEGFPTLKLYDNGVGRYIDSYRRGERDIDMFIDYLTRTTGVEPRLQEKKYIEVGTLPQLKGIETQLLTQSSPQKSNTLLLAFVTPWIPEWSLKFSTYIDLLTQLNRDDVQLIIVDGSVGDTAELTRYYKVDRFPTFVYRDDLNQRGFRYMDSQAGLNLEVLDAFLNGGIGQWFDNVEELNHDRLREDGGERRKPAGAAGDVGRKYQVNHGEEDTSVFVDDEMIELLFHKLREF
ncbi:hypothetical protein WICPIJ_010069 [Wickerhamomyces pijperi]|uniref:Thioredoxin domain-containing protein n=1 Tax=Wickerhamomyces pijperi TaxID=599730 RepID=A0A9P8PI25_WICPI|nr:hypothetical protein WICPIJ_010069 [Wickerhamomyces pijperi]